MADELDHGISPGSVSTQGASDVAIPIADWRGGLPKCDASGEPSNRRSIEREPKPMIRSCLFCLLLVTGVATAAPRHVTAAQTRFALLQEQIRTAHHNGDTRKVLSKSLEFAAYLHYSGPAVEQVAVAYAAAGESERP